MRYRITLILAAIWIALFAFVTVACKGPLAPDGTKPSTSKQPGPAAPVADARVTVFETERVQVETRSGQQFNSVDEWERGSPDHFSGQPTLFEIIDSAATSSTAIAASIELALSMNSRIGPIAYPDCAGCAGARRISSLIVELKNGGSTFAVAAGIWMDGHRACLAARAGSTSTCGCYDGIEELLEMGLKSFLEKSLKDALGLAKAVAGVVVKVAFGLFKPNIALAPPSLPSLAKTILPTAVAGQAYEASFNASGGTQPYSWSIVSGRLPDGLQLTREGRIIGAPRSTGGSEFEVCLADSLNLTVSATFDIDVVLRSSPGSGSDPGPTPIPLPQPNLTGIMPAPRVTSSDISETFTGENLADVIRFDLVDPSGRTWTLSGTQLTNRSATAITVLVTFGGAGTWRATAVTGDGRVSNRLTFGVITP